MKINLVREIYDDEEPILDVLPVQPDEAGPPRTEAIETMWGLLEVLLKAPRRLDAFVRDPKLQGKLIAGFTAIVVAGFVLYGLVLALLLSAVPPGGVPRLLTPQWSGTWRSAAALCATYPVGLLLATLLCLPSYFYFALLGGAKMSLREVLTHSLKGKAATTVLLMGLLPIYAVVMLGLILLGATAEVLAGGFYVGLVLPFVTGLRGAQSIYSGFRALVNALPPGERQRRYLLPDWLVVVWAVVFTVTAPLVLYELWVQMNAWN
jgi:hypothetical protein